MKNRNKKIMFSIIIVLIAIFGIVGVNQLNNTLVSKVTPKDEILLSNDKDNKTDDNSNKKEDKDITRDEKQDSKKEYTPKEDKDKKSNESSNDKAKENTTDNNEKIEQSIVAKNGQTTKSNIEDSKKAKTNVNKNNNTSTNSKETTKSKEKNDKVKSIQNHEKKQVLQMLILDTVNNKTLFSGQVPLKNNKENFNTIMNNFLKSNRVKHINRGGYIAMMYGLSEFDAGPNSGWCYYVNGVKSPVGIAGYVPKNGDKIVWKFLEDGVNN